MPRFRHRSASVGSLQDGQTSLSTNNNINESDKLADLETAKSLLLSLLYIRDRSGKSFLHSNFNLNIAKGLLDRAKSLDDIENKNSKYWQRKFLLQADPESGYTPFHRAVLEGNLSALLLFLRHAMDDGCDRLTQRPMTVLHAAESAPKATTTITGSNFDLAQTMATAKDKEGLTPLELLGKLQKSELTRCRHSLNACRPQVCLRPQRRTRQISFDIGEDHEQLSFLSDNMDILEEQRDCNEKPEIVTSYACEVVTFGRPHHCALGVVQGSSSSSKEDYHSSTFCPQRVQEFSQDRIRRAGSAVAVAAATHHTLVATRNGNLYAFGFGKGGRLGIGDIDNQQCPLPRRVMGPLMRRKVVGVAAAPNHSLAVTKDGILFAWGSNRFGQLGESSNNGGNCRSLPRRVEDMKNIPCIAVAAGEKHSVSLSRKGEVYVWGDNTAGQLGVPRRTGIQKVQRVETLWNGTQPKIAIAIAAAEQSTLVLTCPLRGVTQVNGIYSWGHGSHVPIKVHFENNTRGNDEQERRKSFLSTSRRVVNPVAIASAKYHNVCTTSDGHVYTWGLHAESLGRTNAKTSTKQSHQGNSTSGRSTSSPQLVTGMLPENGGGFAVALSASEQYTAVVTDSGSLYTWGATHGKNILGHEGVRWQPSPKRVPGVHRAVNVAIAKEHTVLLIGASFPAIPKNRGLPSLEYLSARKIAEYVDLFNVVPILIMGERTECSFLVDYCSEFIRRNLDGVLNVGKKSVMNQYLNDALADSLYHSGKRYRDDHHHPYITDVVCAGSVGNPSFDRDWLSTPNKWIEGCKHLSQSLSVKRLLADAVSKQFEEESGDNRNKTHRSLSCGDEKSRLSSVSCSSEHESKSSSVISSREGCLDKCIKNITIMDLSTAELANGKSVWLAKEIRGVRKKLNQIAKLHEAEERSIVLSTEQRAKVDRRPVLDAELYLYESALEDAEKRIRELSLEEQDQRRDSKLPKHFFVEENGPNGDRCPKDDHNENGKEPSEAEISLLSQKKAEKSYTCQLCSIKCPDETSFELHENGRKHRNRVLQVAEEEKKKVAASIMEQHQLEQLKSSVASPHTAEVKNAWGVPSAQPKYKLPPPPHPAAFPVPSSGFNSGAQGTPAKSSAFNFRKILGEESGKTKRASVSPVWATPKAGSTSCVPLDIYAAPSLTPPEADGAHRNSYSLVDFLAPKPIASPKIVVGAPWSSQHTTTPASMKSLADIQAEETDFKTRQDKSYEQGGGTWFIERKERADSFQEIQLSAKKEREENLLIQEQFRIEAQIKRDLAMERESEKKQKIGAMKRSSKGRNTNDPTVRSNRSTKKERSIAKGRNQDGNKKEGKTRNTRNYGHGPKKNKPQQS